MVNRNRDAPPDLIVQLVQNYNANKPLLQDVPLYRGSQLPDQTQGSFSKEEMHGSLLPQVAASYTHNWSGKDSSFIGVYPIDRENTRFYADYGLEKKLSGQEITSYSVADVERKLLPLVEDVVGAMNSKQRGRAEDALEQYIKKSFYEAAVPTKTPEGAPNRPKDLFFYTGRPDIAIRQAIPLQMEKVTPANEHKAKAVMLSGHRNEAGALMHDLSVRQPEAVPALAAIQRVAQKDYTDVMAVKHGAKPLNKFLDGLASEPLSKTQEQLGRLAKAMADGLQSASPDVRKAAEGVAARLSALSPDKTSFNDLVRASISSAQRDKGVTRESGSGGIGTLMPQSQSSSKDVGLSMSR